MMHVVLVFHLMVAVALVGLVLMQRSEGGALGMGGGGGSLMSGRGAADVLVRGTSILGAIFFATSITLALLAGGNNAPRSVVDAPASSPLAPITEMIDNLTKMGSKPAAPPSVAAPAPAPAPVAAVPAAPAPGGEVAPAPDSVVQRAAPLPEAPPPAVASPAAPRAATAPAPASRPSVTPSTATAPRPAARPPVQITPPAALTSVNPTESSEPQIPADKPRGRAGPDE